MSTTATLIQNPFTTSNSTAAIVNYFPPDGVRQAYPGTAGYQRRKFDPRKVQIDDIRGREAEFELDVNGFQLVRNDWSETRTDATNDFVKRVVYPETVGVMKGVTGATDVVAFSHQIRTHSGSQVVEMAAKMNDMDVLKAAGPNPYVHIDNSEAGSITVLQENVPALEFERRKGSHWAIMNLWRPIEVPATREPLALLDSRTVKDEDFIPVWLTLPKPGQGAFDNAYNAGSGFEIAQVLANERHRWYYFSDMDINEALVFKQFDSKRDGRSRYTPHCAIQTPKDHGPVRKSIEVRCLVFWEGEAVT